MKPTGIIGKEKISRGGFYAAIVGTRCRICGLGHRF